MMGVSRAVPHHRNMAMLQHVHYHSFNHQTSSIPFNHTLTTDPSQIEQYGRLCNNFFVFFKDEILLNANCPCFLRQGDSTVPTA